MKILIARAPFRCSFEHHSLDLKTQYLSILVDGMSASNAEQGEPQVLRGVKDKSVIYSTHVWMASIIFCRDYVSYGNLCFPSRKPRPVWVCVREHCKHWNRVCDVMMGTRHYCLALGKMVPIAYFGAGITVLLLCARKRRHHHRHQNSRIMHHMYPRYLFIFQTEVICKCVLSLLANGC